MYIFHNGEIIKKERTAISIDNQSYQYGYGLFETIKILNKKVCFFNEHFNRMKKSCGILKMDFNYDENTLRKYADELINKNNFTNGALKVILSKKNNGYDLVMLVRKHQYDSEAYKKGFSICVSETIRNENSIMTYLKTTNYLENIYAKNTAKDKGYDETLFLNTKGYIAECTTANIFWVKEESLFTPSLDCGILKGIMREQVLKKAKEKGIRVNTGKYTLDFLKKADEIFLTNSLMEIMPVSYFVKGYDIDKYNITFRLAKSPKHTYTKF